ncbi:nurim homolog isoform X1 [Bacillus rossius redtenbacheri]|uniref:nurim homolog isoform X1 n=1 Tax=Bacillus rossius redtenbacheri TaxID=93214 RepID=UPI002FDE4161
MAQIIYMVTTVVVSTLSTLATFWTMYNFAMFCWNPWRSSQVTDEIFWSLFVDLLLLAMFVLQHSVMKAPFLRSLLEKLRLHVLERPLYVLSSSLTLLLLMGWWHHTPHYVAWQVDEGRWLGSARAAFHVYAWVVIYFGCFIFDIADLLGVKQVYYDLCGMNEPAHYRSKGLCRFLCHYRHPSFSAFCLVFWLQSLMSLDRLLLAVYMTGYMAFRWNLDQEDYNYHKSMLNKKEQEIS